MQVFRYVQVSIPYRPNLPQCMFLFFGTSLQYFRMHSTLRYPNSHASKSEWRFGLESKIGQF